MRIVHLLQSAEFSGAENVVTQIMNMFRDEKKIEMIYVSPRGTIQEYIEELGFSYYGIESLSVKNVRDFIKMYRPDIIHAHDVTASITAAVAVQGTRIKVISHMHVNHENMTRLNVKTILYMISSFAYKHIFWVSKSCFENYIFKSVLEKRSSVLLNIIDREQVIKKSFKDLEEYDYSLIYVGRLTYQKNPERLLKVIQLVLEQLPNLKIAIVGKGDMFDYVKKVIDEKNLGDSVKVLGFMENPYKIIRCAKVMVMTSRYEGLPMTVLESLALGTPVVSTPVDGLIEVITNGYNGYLENKDQELANRICELIKNKEKLKDVSQNAINSFNKMMDIESYKMEIKGIYEY